jgi:hypothetical protein
MSAPDLEQVIQETVDDVQLPPEPIESLEAETPDATPTEPLETSPEPAQAVVEPPKDEPVKPEVDEFEKLTGIPQFGQGGRENRIPWSRTKKINEKAVRDAKAQWEKGLETTHAPLTKYQELETKTRTYEDALSKYVQFEQIMMTDPARFLSMVATLPGYQQALAPLFQKQSVGQQEVKPQVAPEDEMPQPDGPDGSYTKAGLRKLVDWNRDQAVKAAEANFEKKYGKIAKSYDEYERTQAALPDVQRQISAARQWRLFNENETEIVKALQQNPTWGLEAAYLHVVQPKIDALHQAELAKAKTDRESLRAELIKEIKQAPKSTSVSTSPSRSSVPGAGGNRNLEDVMVQALKDKGLL